MIKLSVMKPDIFGNLNLQPEHKRKAQKHSKRVRDRGTQQSPGTQLGKKEGTGERRKRRRQEGGWEEKQGEGKKER